MAKSSSALPLLAGGAALVFLGGKKKKKKKGISGGKSRWGIQISSDCMEVNVVDVDLFHKFMFGAFNELVDADPSLSLIQMSDALFGDVAPNCSGFPEDPESDQVAELYAVIARNVGQFMVADPRVDLTMGGLIDEATKISFTDWYRAWRNYPSSDPTAAPQDQVSFATDMSNYTIGPEWYTKTVLPFVAAAGEAGRAESAFEDFANNRGVKVGQFVMPISGLPQDEPKVVEFLNVLQEAVARAQKEIVGA